MKRGEKKAQVWIETVIYTLIAFALIGLVLGFAKPKIEELQDKAIIEQSIQIMENIQSQIESIQDVPGNKRKIELNIKKGSLMINPTTNRIIFQIESRYQYSENGKTVNINNLNITTITKGRENKINITLDLQNQYDVEYNEKQDEIKIISASEIQRNFFIENKGQKYEWGTVAGCNAWGYDCESSLDLHPGYTEASCSQENPDASDPTAYYCKYFNSKQTINIEVE